MDRPTFETPSGVRVPTVTTDEMRAVDRVAVEEIGIELVQMMENAGRALAEQVRQVDDSSALVVAGNGGNGGGGMACARHLRNHGVAVEIVLDRKPSDLTGVAAKQYRILNEMDVGVEVGSDAVADSNASVTVDALIGYGLSGAVRDPGSEMIRALNQRSMPVVSLDVPSGIDATSGEPQGVAVDPERTVTLALPKIGLANREEPLVLADISVPHTVYDRLDIAYESPFERSWSVTLSR